MNKEKIPKKNEMAYTKEKKEEREKNDTKHIKKKESINILREHPCNKEY